MSISDRTACAGTYLGRSLGARWRGERLQRDALVTDLEDLELLGAARRVKDHAVAWPRLHQGARQRRLPADMVAIQIDLIEADDAYHTLSTARVGVPNRRPEEDLPCGAATSRGFWIHHFRRIDSLGEKADAPINLTQSPFVVLIVGVLAAITVARRPGHHLRHRRPFPGAQEPQLVSQPLEAARRDVVLHVAVRFLRKRHANGDGNPSVRFAKDSRFI